MRQRWKQRRRRKRRRKKRRRKKLSEKERKFNVWSERMRKKTFQTTAKNGIMEGKEGRKRWEGWS